MRRSSLVLTFALLACIAAPAAAEDYPFAIRFGLALLEPTADSNSGGLRREFDTQSGIDFAFEWTFMPRLGLEAAVVGAADVDVDDGSNQGGALTFAATTVGLNGHLVRSDRMDWAIGVFLGRSGYGDIDWTDDSINWRSEDDTVWGVQTFLDIPIKKGGRWGVGVGLKWISTSLDLDNGASIGYDPLIARVSGVFRWGTPR